LEREVEGDLLLSDMGQVLYLPHFTFVVVVVVAAAASVHVS